MSSKATEATTTNETEQHGIIGEVLPKSMYAVRLQDGRTVRASVDATARHGIVRLLAGDSVLLRLTQHDSTRARITKKL